MSNKLNYPIVMIGGGGHASVLLDILLKQHKQVIAIISPHENKSRSIFDGIVRLKKNEDIKQFRVEDIKLVNGIGMLPNSELRYSINEYFMSLGYRFESVIADSAMISTFASLGNGSQVLPNAIINAGSVIGNHTIINTGALIEHDCCIGEYNHIAPRATICGQVTTKEKVFIGAHSIVTQNILIDAGVVIGAGTTINKNIERYTKVILDVKNRYKKIEVSYEP